MEVMFILVKAQDKIYCHQLFSMYTHGNEKTYQFKLLLSG